MFAHKRCHFRPGIRCHNRARSRFPVVAKRVRRQLNTALDLVHRKLRADDARRHHQHFVFRAADFFSDPARSLQSIVYSFLAGAGVGAGRVDGDSADMVRVVLQPLHVHQHRRGLDLIGGEDARCRTGCVTDNEREIQLAVFLQAAVDARHLETVDFLNRGLHVRHGRSPQFR